mmetsp:Transcript_50213/g.166279  ORF Transcript_50213/g.166279 Transcript_50213/m.166279 type:complete len:223 (+) Transcript_50213:580-1248(+)
MLGGGHVTAGARVPPLAETSHALVGHLESIRLEVVCSEARDVREVEPPRAGRKGKHLGHESVGTPQQLRVASHEEGDAAGLEEADSIYDAPPVEQLHRCPRLETALPRPSRVAREANRHTPRLVHGHGRPSDVLHAGARKERRNRDTIGREHGGARLGARHHRVQWLPLSHQHRRGRGAAMLAPERVEATEGIGPNLRGIQVRRCSRQTSEHGQAGSRRGKR